MCLYTQPAGMMAEAPGKSTGAQSDRVIQRNATARPWDFFVLTFEFQV